MIEITAFGGFQIAADGLPVTLTNRKSQAVLCYLASHSDQQQARATLAALFWPDNPDASALNNLSKALGQIRKILEQVDGGQQLLETTRHTLCLTSSALWRLDANVFSGLLESARASTDPAESAAFLEQAVSLYQGEFLSGLSLEDCPTFEGWLLLHRENLTLAARDSHHRLADFYLQQGEFEAAQNHARRQLVLDPWYEAAYRQLMRALNSMGLRGEALAQYEACRKTLWSELGLEPEATTRALYEQIKAGKVQGMVTDEAAPSQAPTARLPKQPLPLVGRERELGVLMRDLADPECRMITIMGPGGVGKTSLALEAAWRAAYNFRDGAAFVPLEHLQAAAGGDLDELLAAAAGTALELTFSGRGSVGDQLFKQLHEKEMLLVWDNFEHLLAATAGGHAASAAAAFLLALLEQAPQVKLLVTSRERFAIPPEYVLALQGLPLPETDIGPDRLSDYGSVRLFVDQARRNLRDFRLTAANAHAVAAICRLLDGLPLGIELAARWVNHFDPEEIASAIADNLDFLAAVSAQAVERHQSIRATFAYSWQMLTSSEQQMLAQLSLISGQFSRKAAQEITGGALGDLVRLQSKSLLRQEGPGVYSLHQLLRQFAAEKLAEQPAQANDSLRRRYSAYYMEELAKLGEGFNQAWTREALREIAFHIENMRCAWQQALEMGSFDLTQSGLQPLYHYLRIQGLFHEALQLFSRAACTIRAHLDRSPGDRLLQELLGRSLLRQGRLAWLLADTEHAVGLLEEGLEHLRRAQSERDLARGHAYLGEALLRKGQVDAAGTLLDRALALYRQEGNSDGTAKTLELKAEMASSSGRVDEANDLFQESIAVSKRSGNRRLEGRAYHDWGWLLVQEGKMEQASELLQQSLAIARELELRMPIAFNQTMLACVDRHFARYDHARRRLLRSLSVLEDSGYVHYLVRTLNMLGEVQALLGQTDEAQESLGKSLGQLQEMESAVSPAFEYLILDFLIAASYLMANTGREPLAREFLDIVLAKTDPENYLASRAQQSLSRLSSVDIDGQDLTYPNPTSSVCLADLLSRIRF